MPDYENLCMGCMRVLEEGKVCSFCGYNNDTSQQAPYLACKSMLNERYIVGQMIEHSSDGVTYMGYDTIQKSPIKIKEFLPLHLATKIAGNNNVVITPGKTRDFQECMQNFLDIWRNLAKMRELSAIIPVYDIFEENGTAYSISEHMEYITLRDYLLRSEEGYLPWDKVRIMLMPVLSTLVSLHNSGIVHRAISPNSLVVCRDGKVRLTNFSIREANTQQSCLVFEEQMGYTALEQYNNDYQQGPWTDIYGFAATLYRTLVGNIPIDAQTREINDKLMIPARITEQIPAYVINAMGNALQIYPADRTRSVEQLRNQLSAAPSEAVQNAPEYSKSTTTPRAQRTERAQSNASAEARAAAPQAKKKNIVPIIIAVIVVVALVATGAYFGIKNANEKATTTEPPTNQVVELPVPRFLEYTETEIRNNSTYTENFDIQFEYDYHDTIELGVIFKQSVESGTNVEKGSTITLTVSKGVETIILTNCTGLMYDDAKEMLEEKGFVVTRIVDENDGSRTEGRISSQVPEGGKAYKKGTEVVFRVWGEVIETTTEDASQE